MKYEDLIESKQFLVSVSAYGRTYAVRVDDIREFMHGKVVVGATPIGWVFKTPAGRFRDAFVEGHVKPDERASWTPVYLQPTTSGDVAKPCEFCGFPHKKSQRVHGECPHCEGCWLGPQPAETKSMTKSKRGFAAMTPEQQKAIASKGGKAAHREGAAHQFSSEEARAAGAKGGKAAHKKGKAHRFTSEEASAAGRKGGLVRRGEKE